MDNFPGKLLGIDHGAKVIGFATCDRIGLIATPLTLRYRASKKEDFAFINSLIEKYEVAALIVGMPPRPPDFVGHSQSDTVRLWGQRLASAVSIPVYFWDEGLTSVDAQALFHDADQDAPERIDAHAAAVMLQSFLDALRDYGADWPEQVMAIEE
ncbi:MAG: Holliday junction resolvase RuvX [Chloroflexi bacterium]|nr:Holliday junction resolvase RuvX [Chloroflexota bacterium]